MPKATWSRPASCCSRATRPSSARRRSRPSPPRPSTWPSAPSASWASACFTRTLQGRHYPPEALQAFVLNKLRQDASRQIGDFRKVVITVPAYFDEVRRKATQDAGYMAGLEVLDIINEPTAAAIAYGFLKGFLNRAGRVERAAQAAGLRPGRRHVRRHRDGDPRQRVSGPGDRRRRAAGRPGLGPAAGRFRGRGIHAHATSSTRAKIRTRPAGCGASAKTPSARSRPAARSRSVATTRARPCASKSRARSSRR